MCRVCINIRSTCTRHTNTCIDESNEAIKSNRHEQHKQTYYTRGMEGQIIVQS